MKRIHLEGVTQRGKQLVKEHGHEWFIILEDHGVPCLNGSAGFFIGVGSEAAPDHKRWIKTDGSPNFAILNDLEES